VATSARVALLTCQELAMTEVTLTDIARPFLWIAAVSFTAGFAGYVALAPRLAGL
jgi:hypothetical protein